MRFLNACVLKPAMYPWGGQPACGLGLAGGPVRGFGLAGGPGPSTGPGRGPGLSTGPAAAQFSG